ncbi:MAG: SCP2 sterol-binding domain-containing protein [Actinomycetota bacterium]
MTDERVYLWEQTRGKKDEEIMDFVNRLSGRKPATFLELIMALFPNEIDPEQAQDCTIGLEITADEKQYTYLIEVKDKEVVYADRGDPSTADATMAMSLPTLIKIVTEELGGVKAFLLGKLWVRGDPVFAYSLPKMFPFKERKELVG